MLHTKYPPHRNGAFFWSRLLRIYPLWWGMLIASFILEPRWVETPSPPEALSLMALFGLDSLVAFESYPHTHWTFIPSSMGIAWTLAAELTFYSVAP